MRYTRIRTRVDYFCFKTKRIQAINLVHYHIANEAGEVTEVVPAKKWLGYRRKIKNQRRRNELPNT